MIYKVIKEDTVDITDFKPKYKLIRKLLNFEVLVAHFYAKIEADDVAHLLNMREWHGRESSS